MRIAVILLALGGLMAAGCLTLPSPPPPAPATMTAWGPGGGFVMNYGANCAGKVSLTNGSATVNDPCFTGDDNVVLCSDNSGANAVRCTVAPGSLQLSGSGNDVIAYARVK